MTDLDKRLEADGRTWRLAIGTQSPAKLPSTAPTGRTWNRWLLPAAAAAALVGVTAGVFGLAHVPRARNSGPAAATAQAELGCTIVGLAAQDPAPGTTGQHTSAQALAAAGIPATVRPKSYLAVVTDPTAPKLGLGSADVARLMWVFTAQTTDVDPSLDGRLVGHGPYIPAYPPGTVFHTIWLVDDQTLAPAGSFGCSGPGVSSGPTSHTSAP